jgi:phage terminase small subunit
MPNLTEKQAAFVSGKLAGLPHREAVIHAGYSEMGADQTATKLMRHPGIKAALKAGKRKAPAARGDSEPEDGEGESAMLARNAMPRSEYEDPRDFLMDMMNHKQLPIAVRGKAALDLMPYMHGKVGEKGKKASAKERAQDIASGGEGSNVVDAGGRFRTKAAPGARR